MLEVDEDCRAKDRDPLDIDESEDLQDSAEGDHGKWQILPRFGLRPHLKTFSA
jgi:hypothetical protein